MARRRFRKYLQPGEPWRPPVGREALPPEDVVREEYASASPTAALAARWGVSIAVVVAEYRALGYPPRGRPRQQQRDGLRKPSRNRSKKSERDFYAAEAARQLPLFPELE